MTEFTSWFMLPDGRLRAGWRLLLFLVFFVVALIVFQGIVSAPFRGQPFSRNTQLLALFLSTITFLAAACLATAVVMFFLEHQPFTAVGLRFRRTSASELGLGLAGGATLVVITAGIEWSLGAIRFHPSGADAASTMMLIGTGAVILAISATSEELLFRGYPFQRIVEGANDYVAVVASSLVFGALHMANPHATILAATNTVLAGVLLSLAYLNTRALWLPIGFHFSWNWTLSFLGLPISGVDLGRMPWQAVPTSAPVWLHGGEYGPEGGVIATAVLIAGIIAILKTGKKTSLPEGENGLSPEGNRPSIYQI